MMSSFYGLKVERDELMETFIDQRRFGFQFIDFAFQITDVYLYTLLTVPIDFRLFLFLIYDFDNKTKVVSKLKILLID